MLDAVRAFTNCIFVLLIASIAVAPVRAQAVLEPGDASFNVFLRGTPVGTEEVSVSSSNDGWIIRSKGSFTPPIDLVILRKEIRYDREWNALGFELDGTSAGQPYGFRTSFANGSATTEFTRGDETRSGSGSISPGAIILPVTGFAGYEALAARLSSLPASPGTALLVFVPSQGQMPLRVNRISNEKIRVGDRTIAVRRYQVGILNPSRPFDADIWVDERHRLLRLILPMSNFDVVRTDIVSTSTRLERFRHPGDEDLRIPAAGFSVAATITRPISASESDASAQASTRLPAVVLVAATSTNDRDATVAGVPVIGQLAGALADRGFVAVRYDRRGIGQSGGRAEAATLEDYAEDVRSIIRYLRDRDDVDRDKIAVAGYDEGGWIALLAASRERRIAALILVAAAGTTGAELLLEQQRLALARLELLDEERAEKTALQQRIHDAVLGESDWEGIPDELRRQADSQLFKSILAFDPAKVMERVRQPVLVTYGTLDQEVPEHHAERLVELARGRDRDAPSDLIRIEGANHLLVSAETGAVDEYDVLRSRSITVEFADAMTEWLQRTLGIRPQASAGAAPAGLGQSQSTGGALTVRVVSR